MSNLERLLDERYPETEISHIQRQAFIEGYNAAKEEAKAGQVSDHDLRLFRARMQENIAPFSGPLKIDTIELDRSMDTLERLSKEFKPLQP
jgi:hypothetical protein